jgi:carboxylesterase type B
MILPGTSNKTRSALYAFRLLAASIAVVISVFAGIAADAAVKQKGFASAEEAVKAFAAAMKSNDDKELLSIFGTAAKELISSGDPVSDRQRRERFIDEYDKKNSLARERRKTVLIIGEKDWPFAIPLVTKGGRWFFDTKAGNEEILNRRIGENELSTIQTMLAIVDAEREYAMKYHNNSSLIEYAQKFRSDPGKRNGLYWETKEGEEPSPLGELVVKARAV